MIKKLNNTNIFDDPTDLVDEAVVAKRAEILGSQFTDLINQHKELSGYFECMLKEMESESNVILFLKFARWLRSQPSDFHAELEALIASNQLIDVLDAVLANWLQEMMLTIAARRSRIREVYPTQLFPMLSTISIPIGAIHQESHHANHTDMVYVCGMASAVNARKIFEFGTYRGQTTCSLALVCKDAHIFTLNLAPQHDQRYAPYIGMYIAISPDRDRITQIYHDSRTFDTTPYRESMDYIFIDGDHSYEGVKNDTEKALQLLKPGGVIVWHDYAAKSPGVLNYLAEFSQERPLFWLRKTCLAVYVDGKNPETAQLMPMDPTLEASEYD
jgi:predicted O-methyltransferase YrrM